MSSYWPLIMILVLLLIAGGMDYEDNVRAAESIKAAQQYRHPNIEDYP